MHNPQPPQGPTKIQQHYKAQAVLVLSAIQVVIGFGCIIANGIVIINIPEIGSYGQGVWSGILIILTGGFGIASSTTKAKWAVLTFMILTIITAVFAFALFLANYIMWSALRLIIDACATDTCSDVDDATLYLHVCAALTILAGLEAVLTIVSSGFACHVICCGPSHQAHVVAPIPVHQVQYVTGPDGQQQAVMVPLVQQPQVIMQNTPPYNQAYGPQVTQPQPVPVLA